MIYLLVDKNESQEWEVLKTFTSPINVRGLSGVTYSDISRLSLEERKLEGLWTLKDVYEGTGEFKEFDYKDVTFSEETAEMINTYYYKLMPLAIIKDDLSNRVISKRNELLVSGFEYDGKVYDSTTESRVLLQGYVLESLINPDIVNVTLRLKDDTEVVLTVAQLKSVLSSMYANTEELYIKERDIRDDIQLAGDYDAARAAASWDGVPL